MTVSRLFKNPPWEKGIVSSTDLAALVEQIRGSSSWSADLPTRVCLHSSNTANRFRIRHSGRPVGDGMVNRSIH
jgi:hypothetical protein